MDIRLKTSTPSHVPNGLLSPFSQSHVHPTLHTEPSSVEDEDIDLQQHKRHTGPVGVYWNFDPEVEQPPRYAPQQATPASIHASSQNLTNSIQSSLRDLIMAPGSTVISPVQLGKRAILSLLHRESLLLKTESELDILCRNTKRVAAKWTNEAEQLPKATYWKPPVPAPDEDNEGDAGSEDEIEATASWQSISRTNVGNQRNPSTVQHDPS